MTRILNLRIRAALFVVSAGVLLAACGRDDPASLIGSARDYQAKSDHQAAIIQLKNVLQKQPENGEARLMLGRSALAIGDALSAEKEFRKALEFNQPQGTVIPLLAAAMLQSGQAEKVISEFDSKKLDDPKADAELRARVGEAYLATGNGKAAANAFDSALRLDEKNVRAQLGQARLKPSAGRLDEAVADVEKVVAANPDSLDALLLLSQLKLAHRDQAGARTALERAVEVSPSSPAPRMQLISMLIADNQFDAATSQIAAARAAHVSELQLQYFEALIALGEKDLAKARELVQRVLKRAPGHVPSIVLLGTIEYQEKKFAQAASQFQSALAQAPDHNGARALLARSYLASGQPARAVETLAPITDAGKEVNPAMLVLAGEAYFANGDVRQAATFFERASQFKGQHAAAELRLGQIAMATGDLEGGMRKLESIAADDGAPVQAEMALLAGYLRQGDTGKALDVARSLVKKHPDNPTTHQALGSVLLLRKDIPGARAAFAKAVDLNPTYMPAVTSLAQLDIRDKKVAEARARFEAVLAKEPKNEQALLGLAETMARANASTADVAAVVQKAIVANPDSVNARLALINLHLRGRDARAALSAAQDAAAALGKDPRILDALGRAQAAAGDTNQAIDTFNRLAAAEPRSTVPLLRLASVHISRKEPEKALDALLRAQKIAPADANVTRDILALYLLAGKNEQALKQAKALQSSAPKSAAGFIFEGDVQAASKQLALAEKAYREGLKVDPTANVAAIKLHGVLLRSGKKAEADSLARKWMAEHPNDFGFRGYLGEQALNARDFKSAVSHYQAVVAEQPDSVVALNNLAWSLGQLGDPKALTYAERALKIAPDSPAVLDTMGTLLTSTGDAAKGAEYLSRAVQLAPARHDIRLHYAKALKKAGRTEEARKELTQLQAVSEDFQGKSEVADLLKN